MTFSPRATIANWDDLRDSLRVLQSWDRSLGASLNLRTRQQMMGCCYPQTCGACPHTQHQPPTYYRAHGSVDEVRIRLEIDLCPLPWRNRSPCGPPSLLGEPIGSLASPACPPSSLRARLSRSPSRWPTRPPPPPRTLRLPGRCRSGRSSTGRLCGRWARCQVANAEGSPYRERRRRSKWVPTRLAPRVRLAFQDHFPRLQGWSRASCSGSCRSGATERTCLPSRCDALRARSLGRDLRLILLEASDGPCLHRTVWTQLLCHQFHDPTPQF
mmetsp:Transcript_4399/g.8300  ORF Transcript_4399/g.8300 Transcript_4399/m.8300 type:complete len:271 (-) Transcript_4399:310-1122(-)